MSASAQPNPNGVARLRAALIRILKGSLAAGASDVHLRAFHSPVVRLNGTLRPLDHAELPPHFVEVARDLLGGWAAETEDRLTQLQGDFACEVPEAGRFRVHHYRQANTAALVLRAIPDPIPDFADLRVPPVCKHLSGVDRGLILVTGSTGHGKSTTIASLLERVNQEFPRHVVTVEDPIEYIFTEHRSTFSQRQVGRDVDDLRAGLLGALREDPDWIFVGELRGVEDFELALSAAEAGHVVISTMHAKDSSSAIQRIINAFPPTQRDSARERLAEALSGLIAQRLVPRRGVKERVLVTEVLMRAPTVQDCIRDPSRFRGLRTALESGTSEYGTHTFDQQLLKMVRDGVITPDTARTAAISPNDLVRAIKMQRY